MENEFENQETESFRESSFAQQPNSQPQYEGSGNSWQEIPREDTASYYTGAPRFDPQARYHHVQQDLYGSSDPAPAVKPKKVKKSGGKVWKVILSVFLVVVLAFGCSTVGAYLGIRYMKAHMSTENETGESVQGNNKENNGTPSDTNVLEGDRQNVSINVDKIDTSKQMSAAEIYELNVNSTVGITTSITTNYWGYTTTSAASGSGFVYSSDGYIITNYHVIEGSDSISVSLYDGTSLDAKLVGYDESNDLAVLKVEKDDLVPVIIGDSDKMRVGDTVLAIGNPLGELTFSLTLGTVSALDREVTFSGGMTMNLIQTDCAINSGNSGGALFNLYGEVIGITNAKYSGNSASGASIDNIGFAIPMNQVRALVDSIIEIGYVVKPYIGVTVTDVSEEAQGYGLPAGAAIQGVVEDSPADEAGLKKNDIVTHVNGEEISSSADLVKHVSESAPGDVLTLTVLRKGKTKEISITVGEQSQDMPTQKEPDIQIPNYPNFGWD